MKTYKLLIFYLAFLNTPLALSNVVERQELARKQYRSLDEKITVAFYSEGKAALSYYGQGFLAEYHDGDSGTIFFTGSNLPIVFLQSWVLLDNQTHFVSGDRKTVLTLLGIPMPPIGKKCPSSFCRGTQRCWYELTGQLCEMNYCHNTKSCEG